MHELVRDHRRNDGALHDLGKYQFYQLVTPGGVLSLVDSAAALPLLEEGVALARMRDDGILLSAYLHNLSMALIGDGKVDSVVMLLRESLQLALASGATLLVACCLEGFDAIAAR